MPGYYWAASTNTSGLPSFAVKGGVDSDGSRIFVGRAFHNGDYIPAKVVFDRSEAYIAYDGREIAISQYEVLCEQRFEWTRGFGGNVPHNAVEGGRTSNGEPLYIGRTTHEGSQTIGKVHPSHGCLYIPYGGEELKFHEYEILVLI